MRKVYKWNKETQSVEETTRATPVPKMHVINDSMGEVLWNPAYKKTDPRAYTDSKSRMRELTRAAGCYEVGNDTWKKADDRPMKLDVKGAYERAMKQLTGN